MIRSTTPDWDYQRRIINNFSIISSDMQIAAAADDDDENIKILHYYRIKKQANFLLTTIHLLHLYMEH